MRIAFYVLTEASGTDGDTLRERFERALADALERGRRRRRGDREVRQRGRALWHMRDLAIEVSRTLGPHVGFDVSLRIADMDAFAVDLAAVARGLIDPSCETVVFGHAGDGNLHLAVARAERLADGYDRRSNGRSTTWSHATADRSRPSTASACSSAHTSATRAARRRST